MRATDARECALVAQQGMELATLTVEDRAEPLRSEVERVWPEMCELGLEALGREEPDAGALLLASFGQHQLAAVLEREPEHRRLRRLRAGSVVAQPPRAHQVDTKDEPAVLGREEQVLAAAARTRERLPLEGRERWLERLHGRDVRRPGASDGRPLDERVELAHPRLDFG